MLHKQPLTESNESGSDASPALNRRTFLAAASAVAARRLGQILELVLLNPAHCLLPL